MQLAREFVLFRRLAMISLFAICFICLVSCGLAEPNTNAPASAPTAVNPPAASAGAKATLNASAIDTAANPTTLKPTEKRKITDKEKLNIESVIQIARHAGTYDDTGKIDGSTLYYCLDYIYNNGFLLNGQNDFDVNHYGFIDYDPDGVGLYSQAGLKSMLQMVFGKGIDFDGCVQYAKNSTDMKLMEGDYICISPHDPDGGGGEPFEEEHVAGVSDLGSGMFSVSTDVHRVSYNWDDDTSTDDIVGHSAYTVASDPDSIFGFVVLSAHPA